jgi:hypothetical protein
MINQATRVQRARPGVSLVAPNAIRTARNQANTSAAAASGRARAILVPRLAAQNGSITTESLYLTDERPPNLALDIKPHHICDICWSVKSHPVS